MFSAAHASTTTFLTGGCNDTAATPSSYTSSSRRRGRVNRAFFSTKKKQTPKKIADVGKVTASNVSRNPNMGQLQAGYLFPEIARIRNAHLKKNPDAKIISLGIGDTTVRFCARGTTALFFSRSLILSFRLLLRVVREIGVTSSFRASARSPLAVSSSPHNRNQSQHRSSLAWQTRRWR